MSKHIQKKLRELKIEAHEREIKKHLVDLSKKFDKWKKDKLTSGELSIHIHEYDKGPQEWMMNFYNTMEDETKVARAVAIGLLSRDEVPDDILELIEREIKTFEGLNKKKRL